MTYNVVYYCEPETLQCNIIELSDPMSDVERHNSNFLEFQSIKDGVGSLQIKV